MIRRTGGFLLAFLLLACSAPRPVGESGAPATTAERVVLVIIDGARYSDGLGSADPSRVPRMRALAREGAIVEPFRNTGITKTRYGVPAIWTGTWEAPVRFWDEACTDSNQAAPVPTLFECWRRHFGTGEEDCQYVLGEVTCPWRGSFHAGYGPDLWPRYVTDGTTDRERFEDARRILAEDRPGFLLLYLPDTDHEGHDGDWEGYLAALADADAIVGELWDLLQGDPHYAGRTLLAVTNDHGRHDDDHGGFQHHGDACEGCRRVQLLLLGPGISRGLVSTTPGDLADIVPTLGFAAGVPTPFATGRVLEELFLPAAVAASR